MKLRIYGTCTYEIELHEPSYSAYVMGFVKDILNDPHPTYSETHGLLLVTNGNVTIELEYRKEYELYL